MLNAISWECEIKTRFLKENLGCGRGVSSAISWFFENETQGIILEDDILPSVSFFRFCDEMLEKFKDDTRIGLVSGWNRRGEWKTKKLDYFFSVGEIWGWASWRRVWKKYDFSMKHLDNLIASKYLALIFNSRIYSLVAINHFIQTKLGNIDTWDYQFYYMCYINSYMGAIPSVSLTENIGFESDEATHTFGKNPYRFHAQEMTFPLRENPLIMIDLEYWGVKNHLLDNVYYVAYRIFSIFRRVAGKIKRLLRGVLKRFA